MRVANGTVYWTPFIGTVTTKCMGQERWSSRKEVPMTRIDQLRSRVRGQLSSTVLKTNAKSDLDRVEFIGDECGGRHRPQSQAQGDRPLPRDSGNQERAESRLRHHRAWDVHG